MRYSRSALSARADALCSRLNGGSLLLLGGAAPASPDAPATDAPLYAVLRFQTPAFKLAVDGVAEARAITPGVGRLDGLPTWFRCLDKLGAPVVDGDVAVEGAGGADLLIGGPVSEDGEVRVLAVVYREEQR